MTSDLMREKQKTAEGALLKFNLHTVERSFAAVTVGTLNGKNVAVTYYVTLPNMTNLFDVRKGDELIMEAQSPPKKDHKRKSRTWKDDARPKRSNAAPQGQTGKESNSNGKDIETEV